MTDDEIKRLRESVIALSEALAQAIGERDALLDRLEAAERERNEARDCAQESADIMRRIRDERDALRAERDAMAALLREARGSLADAIEEAIDWYYDSHGDGGDNLRPVIAGRAILANIDAALAAKEQK